jgi:hypothetical protein
VEDINARVWPIAIFGRVTLYSRPRKYDEDGESIDAVLKSSTTGGARL